MIVDIIILSYTKSTQLYKMTHNCISSLVESEINHTFNIIVVESNKNFYEEYSPYSNCKIVIPKEEFNYNKFCNIGLSLCNNDWVVLCNNDLIFHKNWFSVIEEFSNNTAYKSFSPWNSFEEWHSKRMRIDQEVFEGYGIGHELCGWCIAVKREIFNTITLNERVEFWFSDNVYVDELIKHDIKHVLLRNSIVDHMTSKTLLTMNTETIKQLTEEQCENYWNRDND